MLLREFTHQEEFFYQCIQHQYLVLGLGPPSQTFYYSTLSRTPYWGRVKYGHKTNTTVTNTTCSGSRGPLGKVWFLEPQWSVLTRRTIHTRKHSNPVPYFPRIPVPLVIIIDDGGERETGFHVESWMTTGDEVSRVIMESMKDITGSPKLEPETYLTHNTQKLGRTSGV